MVQAYLKNVMADTQNNSFVLIVGVRNSMNYLPIWIGSCEGMAILTRLKGTELPRPMTHDLLSSIIHGTDTTPNKLILTQASRGTYFALLFANRADGDILAIDIRPSDGIALAVREKFDIFIDDRIDTVDPVEQPEKHERLMGMFRPILPDDIP